METDEERMINYAKKVQKRIKKYDEEPCPVGELNCGRCLRERANLMTRAAHNLSVMILSWVGEEV